MNINSKLKRLNGILERIAVSQVFLVFFGFFLFIIEVRIYNYLKSRHRLKPTTTTKMNTVTLYITLLIIKALMCVSSVIS